VIPVSTHRRCIGLRVLRQMPLGRRWRGMRRAREVAVLVNSGDVILLHDRVAVGALQLVGGVRLQRVLAAHRALVALRHGLSLFAGCTRPQWRACGRDRTGDEPTKGSVPAAGRPGLSPTRRAPEGAPATYVTSPHGSGVARSDAEASTASPTGARSLGARPAKSRASESFSPTRPHTTAMLRLGPQREPATSRWRRLLAPREREP